MKKSELKSLIREAVSTRLTTESTMGDMDIIAQESATFDEFVNNIKTDPDYKSVDVNDAEVKAFLQQMYDDAQGMSESKRVKKTSIKEIIRGVIRAQKK
jgi:hypothetical protein